MAYRTLSYFSSPVHKAIRQFDDHIPTLIFKFRGQFGSAGELRLRFGRRDGNRNPLCEGGEALGAESGCYYRLNTKRR